MTTEEAIRRQRVAELNAAPGSRENLELKYGKVWDTAQLSRDFEVLDFQTPYVIVKRRSDGARGSLEFQHMPRFYFNWMPT